MGGFIVHFSDSVFKIFYTACFGFKTSDSNDSWVDSLYNYFELLIIIQKNLFRSILLTQTIREWINWAFRCLTNWFSFCSDSKLLTQSIHELIHCVFKWFRIQNYRFSWIHVQNVWLKRFVSWFIENEWLRIKIDSASFRFKTVHTKDSWVFMHCIVEGFRIFKYRFSMIQIQNFLLKLFLCLFVEVNLVYVLMFLKRSWRPTFYFTLSIFIDQESVRGTNEYSKRVSRRISYLIKAYWDSLEVSN